MKLILKYTISDDCTYWADVIESFNYESKEKAEYDLLTAWEEYIRKGVNWNGWIDGGRKGAQPEYITGDIKFAGMNVNLRHFTKLKTVGDTDVSEYDEPEILELDKWFNKYAPK